MKNKVEHISERLKNSTANQSNENTVTINKLTEEIINKAIGEDKPIEVKINKQEKISIEQKSLEIEIKAMDEAKKIA